MSLATDCFTSKNGTSVKIRKARSWGSLPAPRAACPVCAIDCGRERELANHIRSRHPQIANERGQGDS